MTAPAHKDKRMLEELFDSPSDIDAKTAAVAQLMKAAKRIVIHTGAGLSNAGEAGCSIPDYRSDVKVAPDGAVSGGVWTLQARGITATAASTPMHLAVPSKGHRAIAEICRRYGKDAFFYISTNVDGLNSRLIPYECLAQLHGDNHLEECATCGAAAFREFSVGCNDGHATGRRCHACGDGVLKDSIINYGENLPPLLLGKAYHKSAAPSTVHICLGTSLSVAPANDLPRETKRHGGTMVIVNIQRTPLDHEADVRIHCKINDFFESLFKNLSTETDTWRIPSFVVKKQVFVERTTTTTTTTTSSSSSGAAVRFCGSLPGSEIPMSNFGIIEVVGGEKVDFTASAGTSSMSVNGIAPVLRLAAAATSTSSSPSFESLPAVELRCWSYYPDRCEPDPARLTLPAGEKHAAFLIAWEHGSSSSSAAGWQVQTVLGDAALALKPNLGRGGGPTRVSIQASTNPSGSNSNSNNTISMDGWFCVVPVKSCPHTGANIGFADGQVFDAAQKCDVCGDAEECWMCLEKDCTFVGCSRYRNKHFAEHSAATGHAIGLGCRDMSVYCLNCAAYIEATNKHVEPQYSMLYRAKFGGDDPMVLITSSSSKSARTTSGTVNGSSSSSSSSAAAGAAVKNDNDTNQNINNRPRTGEEDDENADGCFSGEKEDVNRTGFSVDVQPGCEHTRNIFSEIKEGQTFDVARTCEVCGDGQECWMCCVCSFVGCSRYRNKHALHHFESNPTHAIHCSFSDLSCWCHSCQHYINPRNNPQRKVCGPLYLSKHGEQEQYVGALPSHSHSASAAAATTSATCEHAGQQQQQPQNQEYLASCPHLFSAIASEIAPVALGKQIEKLDGGAAVCEKKKTNSNNNSSTGDDAPSVCGSSDVYVDLSDGSILCSRYANGHCMEHVNEKGHTVVMQTVNSVYCADCDGYVSPAAVLAALRTKGVVM